MSDSYDILIDFPNFEAKVQQVRSRLTGLESGIKKVEDGAEKVGESLAEAFDAKQQKEYVKGLQQQILEYKKLVGQAHAFDDALEAAYQANKYLFTQEKDRIKTQQQLKTLQDASYTARVKELAVAKEMLKEQQRLAALEAKQDEGVMALRQKADAMKRLVVLTDQWGVQQTEAGAKFGMLKIKIQALVDKMGELRAGKISLAEFNKADKEVTALIARLRSLEASQHRVSAATVLSSRQMKGFSAVTGLARNVVDGLNRHIAVYTGGAFAAAGATYALARGLRAAVTAFAEFESNIQRTAAVTGASAEQTERLSKSARDVAKHTVFTAKETAEAMVQLGMAGLNQMEVLTALEPTLRVASIGMLDFGRAADITTNIMQGFQLDVTQMARIADVMAQSITDSNASLEQMGNALSYAAPVAETFGVSLEATTAAMEVLHNAGIKASRAGTGMRRTLLSLYAPTRKAAAALETFGVSATDSVGRAKPFIQIVQELKNAIDEGRGSMALLQDIVGVRAFTAFSQVVKAANTDLQEFYDINMLAAGASRQMQAVIEDTLRGDFKKFQAALEELGIALVDSFSDDARDLLQSMTKALNEFTDEPENIRRLAESISRFGDILLWVVGIASSLSLVKLFGALSVGAATFGAAIATTAASALSFVTNLGVLGTTLKYSATAMLTTARSAGILAASMGVLKTASLALFTTPIGAGVVLLTSLAAAAWYVRDSVSASKDEMDAAATATEDYSEKIEGQVSVEKRRNKEIERNIRLQQQATRELKQTQGDISQVEKELSALRERQAQIKSLSDGSKAFTGVLKRMEGQIKSVEAEYAALNSRLLDTQKFLAASELRKLEFAQSEQIRLLGQLKQAKEALLDSEGADGSAVAIATLTQQMEDMRQKVVETENSMEALRATIRTTAETAEVYLISAYEKELQAINEALEKENAKLDVKKLSLSKLRELVAGANALAQNYGVIVDELKAGGDQTEVILKHSKLTEDQYKFIVGHLKNMGLIHSEIEKREADQNKELDRQVKLREKIQALFAKQEASEELKTIPQLEAAKAELKEIEEALKLMEDSFDRMKTRLSEKELAVFETDLKRHIELQKKKTKQIEDATKVLEKERDAIKKNADQMEAENKLLRYALDHGKDLNKVREQAKLVIMEEQLALAEKNRAAGEEVRMTELQIQALRSQIIEQRRLAGFEIERNQIEQDEERIKKIKDEMKKLSDDISELLTEAIFEGFENGKSFAQNFKDILVNMFKTMVLRVVVQPIVNDMVGSVGSLLGVTGGGAGVTDALGLANSASSIFSGESIIGSSLGYGLNFGASIAGGAGMSQAAMLAAQTAEFGVAGASATASSLAYTGAAGTTAGAGVAAALPYLGWAVAAIGLIASFMKDIPDPRFAAEGPLGQTSVTGLQDVEGEVVQQFVDTINQFEQGFLALLTNAEREALAGFEPSINYSNGMISAHGDAGTENELAQVIITRITQSMRQLDTDIADAMRARTLEIKGTRSFNMEDVQALVDEVLGPILIIREALDEHFGGTSGIENIAETAEIIKEAAGGIANYSAGLATYLDKFFSAEEKVAKMTETLTEVFSELGVSEIPATRQAFRDLIESLDLASQEGQELHGALLALVPGMDQYFTALAGLGEQVDDITGSIDGLSSQLEDFMKGIEDDFAELTLTEFQQEMREISIWFEEATAKAEELGASTEQLAMIQEVAAIRTANAIRELEASIAGLIAQLYGGGAEGQLDYINEQISIETTRIQELNREALDLYNQEMRRYQDAQTAIDRIGDHLAALAQGALSPLTPWERYQTARGDFDATMAAAMGGDPTAIQDVTTRHTALLQASQAYYASSTPYQQDYYGSIDQLRTLAEQLGLVVEPAYPGQSETSALLEALEAQRQALIDQQEQQDREALALELAQQIGDLGLALDTSVWDLLAANGVSIQQLAADFGVNIASLDTTLVTKLTTLADALHVDFLDLAQKLNVDIVGLAQEFGFDVEALGSDLDNWLVRAANTIGSDIFDLSTALGIDIDQLGDLFAEEFTLHLAPLSEDIRTQLAPYLTAIQNASDTEQLETAMSALRTAVNALPEAERQKLGPYLDNIWSSTDDTRQAVRFQDTPLGIISNQTTWTNGHLNNINSTLGAYQGQIANTNSNMNWHTTQYLNLLGPIRENLRYILRYVSDFGNPGYASGTAYVPKDMTTKIHQGEIVIDAKSSDVLRRYGIRVDPQESGSAEVAGEIRALREEVANLRAQLQEHHSDDLRQRSEVAKAQIRAATKLTREQRPRVNTKKVV